MKFKFSFEVQGFVEIIVREANPHISWPKDLVEMAKYCDKHVKQAELRELAAAMPRLAKVAEDREFTKGGLVRGGLAIQTF